MPNFFFQVISIPFAYKHKSVVKIFEHKNDFIGKVAIDDYGIYIDNMLILIFGGIPWQVYFQRVLSAKTEKSAMYLSYVAAIGCLLSGIPPAIIGMIGKAAGKIFIFQ